MRLLTDEQRIEIRQLVLDGKVLEAWGAYTRHTGLGQNQAFSYVWDVEQRLKRRHPEAFYPPTSSMSVAERLSPADRDHAAALLRDDGHVQAIAAVRSASGCDLKAAKDYVTSLQHEFGLLRADASAEEETDMGLAAQVMAIGPLSAGIVDRLGYPAEMYRNVAAGTPVVASAVFEALGSIQSHELAEALGIDPWNFSQHVLDPSRVDPERLAALNDYGWESFQALRDAGFTFYFLPNG